jgi:hypothetical protein
MPKPSLNAKVIARFATTHGWGLQETLDTIVAMTSEQRTRVAEIYATTELLSDTEKIVADSMHIRMKLSELEQRNACPCPYSERSEYAAFCDWHAVRFNAGTLDCPHK